MGELLAALHPHGNAKTLLTHKWVLNIRKVQTLSSRCNLANLRLLAGGSLEGGEGGRGESANATPTLNTHAKRSKCFGTQQRGKQIKTPLLEFEERKSTRGGLAPPPLPHSPDYLQYRHACRVRPASAGGFAGPSSGIWPVLPQCFKVFGERGVKKRA